MIGDPKPATTKPAETAMGETTTATMIATEENTAARIAAIQQPTSVSFADGGLGAEGLDSRMAIEADDGGGDIEQGNQASEVDGSSAAAAASASATGEGGVRAKIGKHLREASAFAKWMVNGQQVAPSAQDMAGRAFHGILRAVMPRNTDGRQPDLNEIIRSPAFVTLRTVGLSLEGQLFQLFTKLLLESKRRLKSQEAMIQQYQEQQLKQSTSGSDNNSNVNEPTGSSGKAKKKTVSKKEIKKRQKALEAAVIAASAIPLVPELTEHELSVLELFHSKSVSGNGSVFLEYQSIISNMLDLVSQARAKLEKREKGNYTDEQFCEQYISCVNKLEKQTRQLRAAASASGISLENLFGGAQGGAMSAVVNQDGQAQQGEDNNDDDDDDDVESPSTSTAATGSSTNNAAVNSSGSSSGDEQHLPGDESNGKNKPNEKETHDTSDDIKEITQMRMQILTVLAPLAVRCQGLQIYTQQAMIQILMGKLPTATLPENANSVQYALAEFLTRLSFTVFQVLRSCAQSMQPSFFPSPGTEFSPSLTELDLENQPVIEIPGDTAAHPSFVQTSDETQSPVPSPRFSPTAASSSSSPPTEEQQQKSTTEMDPEFISKVQKEATIGLMVMLKKMENALTTDRPAGVNRLLVKDEQLAQMQIRQSVEELKQQLKDSLSHTVRTCLQAATEPHEDAIRRIVERLVEIASGKPVTDAADMARLNNLFEFSRTCNDKSCLVYLLIEVFRCAFNIGKIAKNKRMDIKEAEDLRIASLRRNEAEGNDQVIRVVLESVPTLYPISFSCIDVAKDMHLALTKARDNDKSGIKDIAMRRRIKRNSLSNTISQCVIKLGELSAQLYVYTHNAGDFLGPDECFAKAKESVSEWIEFCETTAFSGPNPPRDASNDPGSDSASTDNPNDENDCGNIMDIGTGTSTQTDARDTHSSSSGKKAAKKKKSKGKSKQKK